MKLSKEILDKLRDALGDQGELYPWTTGAEVLTGILVMEDEEQDKVSATDKKSTKPLYKTYEDLAYISAMEATRCHMLIDKLKATIDLLDAQQKYYEAISAIERDNASFGFDLDI